MRKSASVWKINSPSRVSARKRWHVRRGRTDCVQLPNMKAATVQKLFASRTGKSCFARKTFLISCRTFRAPKTRRVPGVDHFLQAANEASDPQSANQCSEDTTLK